MWGSTSSEGKKRQPFFWCVLSVMETAVNPILWVSLPVVAEEPVDKRIKYVYVSQEERYWLNRTEQTREENFRFEETFLSEQEWREREREGDTHSHTKTVCLHSKRKPDSRLSSLSVSRMILALPFMSTADWLTWHSQWSIVLYTS